MKNPKYHKKYIIKELSQIPNVIDVVKPECVYIFLVYISTLNIDKKITINLRTKNAKVFVKGAMCLQDKAFCNLNIVINHFIGNNKARVTLKSVLKDNTNFNFRGIINISKNAHKSDSYLKQNNLVVSKNAICNSSPQLTIRADNVKASHGATVSGFNSADLFYIQSRGLSLKDSKKLLEESFLLKTFGKSANIVLKDLNIKSLTELV